MTTQIQVLTLLVVTGLVIRLLAPTRLRTALPWLVLASLAIPLSSFAHSMIWSSLMLYDDEGYVLHSLRDFLEGGALYDEVYTQYGPFPYLLWKLLSTLGLEPTHVHGRALTLVFWLACSAGCALLAWRLSRQWLATALALAGSLVFLWPMSSEPSHPGSLVCLLGILAALLVTGTAPPRRLTLLLLGALAAMLLLTKVNTGVFLVAALGAWWGLRLAYQKAGYNWLRPCVLCLLPLLPWLLMRPLLSQPAMLSFAAISCAALVSVLLAHRPQAAGPTAGAACTAEASPEKPTGTAPLLPLPLLLGFALTALLILGPVVLGGTSPSGLLEGILLTPLRFPDAFTTPVNWRPGALLLALAGPACVLLLRHLAPTPRRLVLTFSCLGAVLAFLLSWAELVPLNMQALLISYGFGSTWLFCVPAENQDRFAGARQAVALVFLLQALQAFPVGGSQISWGCVLWIPLASARLLQLLAELPRVLPRLPAWGTLAAGSLGVTALLAGSLKHEAAVAERLSNGNRLELPGAESLIVPTNIASGLQLLCLNARLNGDMLFSMPGVYSFNLWTGLPTPSRTNATLWFRLLDDTQQLSLRDALRRHPEAVIIRENSTLDYLRSREIAVQGPLVDHIDRDYEEVLRLESHSLLLRRGCRPKLHGILHPAGPGTFPGTELLAARVSENSLRSDTHIELRLLEGESSRLLLESGPRLTTLQPRGEGEGRELCIQLPVIPSHLPRSRLLLVLKDARGRTLDIARFPGP